MTMHNVYTLSDSQATRITPLGKHSGMDITIQNVNSTGYIYVGAEGITSTNYGFRIMPNHSISFELAGPDSLFLLSSVNAMKAAVIKIGLESQN